VALEGARQGQESLVVPSGPWQQVGKERGGHMYPNLPVMLSISHLGYNERHYLKLHDGSSSFHFIVLFYDVSLPTA